jgi:hypothetical protein
MIIIVAVAIALERRIKSYTFEIGLDHTVSTQMIAEIFNEAFERYLHAPEENPVTCSPAQTIWDECTWFIFTSNILKACSP